MSPSVMPIGAFELAMATLFIVAAGVLSLALSLGLTRSLIVATIRTYAQLLALGIALRWVFQNESPILISGILLAMILASVRVLLGRVKTGPPGLFAPAFWGMFVSATTVTFAVTALIVQVKPWYRAQYVLPIAGMILGNAMTGISLALERSFSDMERRVDEVWMQIALGAGPWEAALPSIRTALTAGLIPTINSMCAVGIVSIPGMMTGQILSGVDPEIAARYQIVVMLMLSAATAIGSMLAVLFAFGKAFDADGRYVSGRNAI